MTTRHIYMHWIFKICDICGGGRRKEKERREKREECRCV